MNSPFRILVTGSRMWPAIDPIREALRAAAAGRTWVIVVHGQCDPRRPGGAVVGWDYAIDHPGQGRYLGADWLAHHAAGELHFSREPHFAPWATLGRSAGPRRNQVMVDLGAHVCLAFPLGRSTGTEDCIRRATKAGIPVTVIEP